MGFKEDLKSKMPNLDAETDSTDLFQVEHPAPW